MTTRAKMLCDHRAEVDQGAGETGFTIHLRPVTEADPDNESFYRYTPGGEVSLALVNPQAAAAFKVGSYYYVDFTEAS